MKRLKMGITAVVIAVLAITVAIVGAQPPTGNGNGIGGRGQGRGIELQVIADTLGIDLQTLQTYLQNGQTIADVATAQNVELSAIVDAVVAKRTEELTQSVTDGNLTQEQADAQIALLKANLNVQLTKAQTQPTGAQNLPNMGQPGQRGNDQLTTIATALGIDAATLQSDLQSGQTIADIAKAQNVELSAITDAVVAARTTVLDQAVADGTLTQEQADAQILVLKPNLNASYTQTGNLNDPMGMGGMDGNGGHGGNGGQPGGNRPNGGPNGNGVPGGNPPAGDGAAQPNTSGATA